MSERVVPRLRRILLLVCLAAPWAWAIEALGHVSEDETAPEIFAFDVVALNEGLPAAGPSLRLDTPRAALESFVDAIRRDQFERAAQALNLDTVPVEQQAERGPRLALMLAFLLRRHDLIDWNEIPDQPDARVLPGVQQSGQPYSRRSIELGELEAGGRPVPISLQRFRAEGAEPVWLFSPFVVDRIEGMYAESRPGLISRWIPLRERLDTLGRHSLVEWIAATALLLATVLIGLAVYYSLHVLARRVSASWAEAIGRVAPAFATLVAAVIFRIGLHDVVLLTGPMASKMDIGSEVVGLVAGAVLLLQSVSAATHNLSVRYVVPLAPDAPENRRTKTTVYVVRRVALVVVALMSIGYILVRVGVFENFGLSVLASAGALGVLIAIAAQPLLGNMVAGLQIAFTDPLRIGDVVVYDEVWATVEDISFAHTVLRTFTDTRLIVPHVDFLSKPFENLSKEGEAVWRIVKIPVDYRVDIEPIRRKVDEIVEGDPRSAGAAPMVEMVEVTADSAVLWIWLRGTSALAGWYLHNEVREKVVAYLKELDGGAFLPRRRHILFSGSDGNRGAPPAAESPTASPAGGPGTPPEPR